MASQLSNTMERMQRATLHCRGDAKNLTMPPIELLCQDARGLKTKQEVDLRNFTCVSNEWLFAIASHPAASGSGTFRTLILAGTSITDSSIVHLSKLKSLTSLDVSGCHALTDAGLNTIRRQLSSLQTLHLDECYHFSSAVLCNVWKDCKRLHSLSVRGCPGVTDAFLQCLATTKRSSEATLRSLDVCQCKNLTSSGISYLANSSMKDMKINYLAVDKCLGVDNVAFFGFETSPGLRSLTSLSLSGLGVDETAVSWIVKGCGASLQCLNVARCKVLSDFALLLMAPLISSPRFIKLNLQECPLITNTGIKNLFSLEEEKNQDDDEILPTSLAFLNLKNCLNIGDDAMVLIGKYGGNLIKLNLKGLRKVSDRGIMELAKGCPLLKKMSLSGRNITVQTFKLLGKLCRKLQVLDISRRRDLESPACFLHLVSRVHPLLRIDLSATNVCDAGVTLLASACRQLENINLSKLKKCAQITDFAAEALASRCFQLRILLLANARGITDRTLTALAFTKIPLEILDLSGNTRVTDEGLLVLCSGCQQIQELRLKGCDRLSQKVVKCCNDNLLPFTKPFTAASLVKTLATGGGNSAMVLEPLPKVHIELLQLLQMQYEAAVVLQNRFRKWQNKNFTIHFLANRRLLRETRAARKIQNCVRDFLAWRRFLHLLSLKESVAKIVLVQAHARGNRGRREFRTWCFTANFAARRIQKFYRPHYIFRQKNRNYNAREIQRVYRGYLGRQRYHQLIYERKLKCGGKIWQWYRKCLNYREFQARSRWLVKKIYSIQGQWRKYKRRQNFTKYMAYYRNAAIKIQSVWRQKLAINHVSSMRLEMNAAALTIQRVFRGHLARIRVAFYRTIATNTAIVIQSQWRRCRARKLYLYRRNLIFLTQKMIRYARVVRRLREIVSQAVAKHHNEAALHIQRCFRGMIGRKRALLFRKIRNAKYARKGQNATQALLRRKFISKGAALCIQHWIRSVNARRRMLKIKKWRYFLAVQCIQRYMKAWIKKMRLSCKREVKIHAVAEIQRVFRGHQGRVYYKAERRRQRYLEAAILIQRIYRGRLGRKRYARIFQAKSSAASKLQNIYRSRQARKLFEIGRAAAALKAKEQHDRSLLGRLEARRNPMDELYRRAKLELEKEILTQLKEKYEAHRTLEERAVRKLKRECSHVWTTADEIISNQYAVRRKLYGVTENVYATHRELEQRKKLHFSLEKELNELKTHVRDFKRAMQEAVTSRRMLEGCEVFDLLKEQGLFLDPESNQRD
ncbi:IQ calmodulin-binding motif-containing protein [Phytophthora infestans]|uniref:IQ calmodulin-binding motif-containing protein n=1 Tax=Phytophthora infestans TaxID=4787 RepID=A0A8S9UE19_PHYIN|nr:IQ calmodulin-binding motif-containing protein [Phytophthora infestans]